MKIVQTVDFSMSLSQDTKTIKDLPAVVGSLMVKKKVELLRQLVGLTTRSVLYSLDLTYMISDLSRFFLRHQIKDS